VAAVTSVAFGADWNTYESLVLLLFVSNQF
jgi:hypothetical protein